MLLSERDIAYQLGARFWEPFVESIATIRSMDVVVPVKRGERVIDVRLRTVAKPDKDVAMLLSQLGLQLPTGSKRVQKTGRSV
jgi:hypothetical protein